MQLITLVILIILLILLIETKSAKAPKRRLTEAERVEQWRTKYTWPPTWQVESEGYKKLMEDREREIQETIVESNERWENWMQYVQSRFVKPFTPLGFKLAKLPKHVYDKLYNAFKNEIVNWDTLRTEGEIPVIHGPDSKFIDIQSVLQEVQKDLLTLHEDWIGGIKLKPTSIYGIRLYRNGSSLSMHCDKSYTHVISSIIHIAHEYDDDNVPWPIE